MKPPNFCYLLHRFVAVRGVKYQIHFPVPRAILEEVLEAVLGPVFTASANTAVRKYRV